MGCGASIQRHRWSSEEHVGPQWPRPWVVHQRLDHVQSTGLRSEPTSDWRPFIGHEVPNGARVELDELRADGFARVRSAGGEDSEGFQGFLQTKHLLEDDIKSILVPTIYCGFWDTGILGDGFRFSLTAGGAVELGRISDKFGAKIKKAAKNAKQDPDIELERNEITGTREYTVDEVLDIIQKYQSREVGGKYAGYGVDDEAVRKLELTKPVVRASDGITGFHWELDVFNWGRNVSLGDAFLLDNQHLLLIEFAIFDQ